MNNQRLADIQAKLLIICGPTATGKTAVAIDVAKKFNGEIVSADSRQVFRGLDIGTGKDLPKNSKLRTSGLGYGYYIVDGVRIWGYDLVDSKDDFSVAQYIESARVIIRRIITEGKLPILVGGTGFYIKGVVDGVQTAEIPRNESLRSNLEGKSREMLFDTLSQIDSIKAGSLNASDKKNPRRLIRAIEVAEYSIDHKVHKGKKISFDYLDTLFVGLHAPAEFINEKIGSRVESRIRKGIKQEIRSLLGKGVRWEDQAMMSLGYRQWRDYFEGGVDEKHVVDEWAKEERKYARRQMTWFRKEKRINWVDVSDSKWVESLGKLIKKWYTKPSVPKG